MKMSYEEVRSSARVFENQGNNVGDIIRTMYNELNKLQSGWDGEAASAFESKLNQLKPHFDEIQQLVGEISQALNQSAETIRQAEEDVSRAWRG